MEKSIAQSDIVCSLAGRDKGKLFFVLGIEEGYALLTDGKVRKLQKAKRKKLRHLSFVSRSDSPVALKIRSGGTVSDREVRKALAVFKAKAEGARSAAI